jgi:transposase
MLTDDTDHVIGVDTHRDHHTLAVVDRNGGTGKNLQIPTDAFGYRRMLAFGREHAPGRRVWAIEGTGSFGAGLTTYLLEHEERVVEIDRPQRPARRNGAKTDELDAVRAAREALSREHLAQPRRRGDREAIRVLMTTRNAAMVARTKAIGQLKALIVGAPEQLRQHFRGLGTDAQLERCSRLRTIATHSAEHRATVRALRTCARQALFLEAQATDLESELEELVVATAPQLLAQPGVGVITAAQILVSWSHAGRLRSEAAFAALAPGSPPSRPAPGRSPATDSTAAATASSTGPCTPWCSPGYSTTGRPGPTRPDAPPRARPPARSSGASSARSPASCSGSLRAPSRTPRPLTARSPHPRRGRAPAARGGHRRAGPRRPI